MLRTPHMRANHSKKGVEMSLQAIIIAVLVLVVLVVLVLIFTKGSVGFYTGVTSCGDRGGSCKDVCESGESAYALGLSGEGCGSGAKCCIPESMIFGQTPS